MVSCVVVGQSNSVLREGFAHFLSISPNMLTVKRGSVGASSAILGAYFIQPGFCKGFDYCIIDLVMFDYHVASISKGTYTGYEISRLLEYLIHTIRIDGCQPIIMVFSPQWANLKHGWIGDIHIRVAQTNLCHYFDFNTFLTRRLDASGSNLAWAYSDASHPTPPVQKLMAALLSDFMAIDVKSPPNSHTVRQSIPKFEVVRIDRDLCGYQHVNRKNSLVEEDFIRFCDDRTLCPNVGTNRWVRGMVINSSASFGRISLQGNIRVVKDLSAKNFDDDRFVMQITPLFADLQAGLDGRLYVSLTTDTPTEPHISTIPETGSQIHQVELSALITEQVTRSVVCYDANLPDPGLLDIVVTSKATNTYVAISR
jgi:hypothetical protein